MDSRLDFVNCPDDIKTFIKTKLVSNETMDLLDEHLYSAVVEHRCRTVPGLLDPVLRERGFKINHHALGNHCISTPHLPNKIIKLWDSAVDMMAFNGETMITPKWWSRVVNREVLFQANQELGNNLIHLPEKQIYISSSSCFTPTIATIVDKVNGDTEFPNYEQLQQLLKLVLFTGFSSCSPSTVLHNHQGLWIIDTNIDCCVYQEGFENAIYSLNRYIQKIHAKSKFETIDYSTFLSDLDSAKNAIQKLSMFMSCDLDKNLTQLDLFRIIHQTKTELQELTNCPYYIKSTLETLLTKTQEQVV